MALPGAPVLGARFGQRLAWSGDLAIVGAPQDKNAGGVVVGAVYLYHRVGSTWNLEARFEGDGMNGVLGDQVAISANGLAAAGRPSSVYFVNPGIIRTFVRNAGAGTWSAANTITYSSYPDNPSALALHGNDLLIGLGVFPFSGYGDFLHERYNPGTGTFTFVTEPGGPNTGPVRSMALQGTVLVMGYPESQSGTPAVQVLVRSTTASSDWYSSGATLLSGESATASAGFGDAVSYSSLPAERIAVGAPRANFPTESGAVYVFKKTGSLWGLEQKIESPLSGSLAHFGHAVSIDGSSLLIGQPAAAGGAGRVFVFDLFPSAPFWRYSNALVGDGLTSATAAFGSAVLLQGARGLVGAPGEVSNTGAARSIDDVHCTMTGFCFGDGTGTACPCGNHSPVGAGLGCLNSFGTGARLAGTGIARVTSDTVQLQLTDTPPTGQAPTFFQGSVATAGGVGTQFGDGLRCASGALIRLGTRVSVGGAVSFGFGVPGDPLVSAQGAIPAVGATRFYQANYRNAVAFCTSATQNSSNGLRITWSP